MTDQALVTLTTFDPPNSVTCLLDEGAPEVSGAAGGWVEIERPRRVSLTDFAGQSPMRLSLDLICDGWSEGVSVQADVDALRRMARLVAGDVRTPIVHLSGIGLPAESLEIDEWVVDDLQLGVFLRDPDTNDLLRQSFSIILLQYVEPDVAVVSKQVIPSIPNYRLYRVRRGDTMPIVAARLLRKATRWREIARLNNLRGPNFPSKYIGRLVKVPKR